MHLEAEVVPTAEARGTVVIHAHPVTTEGRLMPTLRDHRSPRLKRPGSVVFRKSENDCPDGTRWDGGPVRGSVLPAPLRPFWHMATVHMEAEAFCPPGLLIALLILYLAVEPSQSSQASKPCLKVRCSLGQGRLVGSFC
jgi:hypothetical protein